jgi:outer membrane receptor protein involved in Fe transport
VPGDADQSGALPRLRADQPVRIGRPSQAAINYVEGSASYQTDFTQDVADLSVRARPFSTWAGEVSLATGGQYRRVNLTQVSDDIATGINDATGIRGFPAAYLNQPGGYLLTNVFPVSGGYHLWEIFGEAAVPLARNLPLLRALDLNAAVRYTNYSTSGGVTTWKTGLVWEPVSGIRLRGTVSQDIRAPNVPELFAGTVQNTGSVIENGATVPIIQVTRGNASLKPERARTYTAGIVLTPHFAPGLTLSADYYAIDLTR